uniref:Uncharacterized protein n=1 Tax=Anguilla anguilla TaxID=7936 RepID=A0A0E9PBG0_ANGAN
MKWMTLTKKAKTGDIH